MSSPGHSLIKLGCGCVGAALVIGFLTVLLGRRLWIILGGACCFTLALAIIGLIVVVIYSKAHQPPSDVHDEPLPPISPGPRGPPGV